MTSAFPNFFDSADMTGCFTADASPGAINREAAAHGLYFPLYLDDSQSLAAHLLHGWHLPASHRFGTLADNILGMNFKLSNGTCVRLGGRAIKNCTGFDVTRFLLNSRHDLGEATDFVLRLRALASPIRWFGFRAADQDIEQFRRALNRSPWWHALECVDVEMQSNSQTLWIGIRGSQERLSLCEQWLKTELAPLRSSAKNEPAATRLAADALIKTLPSRAVARASSLVRRFGGHARIHLTCGFLRWTSSSAASASHALSVLREECAEEGGHLISSHLPENMPDDESHRISRLRQEWQTIGK